MRRCVTAGHNRLRAASSRARISAPLRADPAGRLFGRSKCIAGVGTRGVDCLTGADPPEDWNPATGTWTGSPIKVDFTGPGTVKTPVPETLIVSKDPNCTVAPTESPNCADSKNTVINLPGGGSLYVAGAQYAPTDNVSISGSSGGTGRIGQIVAWSLFYTGGSRISEFYPNGAGNGVLRLDRACSGPGMTCVP